MFRTASQIESQTRRDFLKLSAAGVSGVAMSGWLDILAARAAETKAKTKSCILLWMEGGASHKDTFDLKPGTKDGGEFKPIQTNAPGVQISEHFAKLAGHMDKAVLLRGMSTAEGAHGRARYYMHTGHREGAGGIVAPSIGSIVSAELGRPEFTLPNFVSIGNRSYGAGFLGAKHHPLVVTDPAKGVEDIKASVNASQFDRRIGLLEEMERGFFREQGGEVVRDHATTVQRAVRMMQSKEGKAFDLSLEPSSSRSAYGSGKFAEGVLMARRLVEVGVPFVEVTLGGWDTHMDNFARVKSLSQNVDQALSALLSDLKVRGLLDTTLVIWMGDFGRTPRINNRGAKPGRDHYPRAWSTVFFGGGIKGGQVIGATDKEGAEVVQGKVSGLDFLATVCTILGVDYTKENHTATGRPIRIVDKAAKVIPGVI